MSRSSSDRGLRGPVDEKGELRLTSVAGVVGPIEIDLLVLSERVRDKRAVEDS